MGKKFNHFEFESVKLLDWADREDELMNKDNPFAIVTLASLKTRERNLEDIYKWKFNLTMLLYRKGYTRDMVIDLYQFLDSIMVLSEPMEIEYNENITKYEEEQKMAYITSAERIGIKKGMEQGIQKGLEQGIQKGLEQGIQKGMEQGIQDNLEVRFGTVSKEIVDKVEAVHDIERLKSLHRQAVTVESLEAFLKLLQ